MNRPAKVTQADVARVLRAAQKLPGSWRVRVTTNGEIIVEPGYGAEITPAQPGAKPKRLAPMGGWRL
jgi:hypothetical protein